MALISTLNKKNMGRNSVHGQVDATYTVFISDSGKRYLQIDTYGSEGRAIPGKKSQSIQLDSEGVQKLIEIARKEMLIDGI
jgi:hypothetical protein